MSLGKGNNDEGYCKCNFGAILKLNAYRLLKIQGIHFLL